MNKSINIEIRGVSFVNKGAELMLHAVKEQLEKKYPKAKLIMEVNLGKGLSKSKTEINKIIDNGLYVKGVGRRYKISIPLLLSLLPNRFLSKNNIVLEKDIDVILDASGFAFGDQWGVDFARKRLTSNLGRWRKQGKKIILLPQAFGPFDKPGMKEEIEEILKKANLIFARDEVSFKYLKDLTNEKDVVKVNLKPDFTNLIKGKLPVGFDTSKHQVAIIPNFKMVVTKQEAEGEYYYSLLKRLIEKIQQTPFHPFFLMHEGKKDEDIAKKINAQLEKPIPIIWESHPVGIKGIIGNVHAVVTSRFHGLVSALSQGTPCLATSWSHKYEMLLKDYNYPDGLLPLDDLPASDEKIYNLLNQEKNAATREKLEEQSKKQKAFSKEMWEIVYREIER